MISITDVGWVSILVGAVVTFGWGFIYFNPRFVGASFQQIHGTKEGQSMMPAMLLEALYLLLLSWLVAIFYLLQMENGHVRGIGVIFIATVLVGHLSSAAWTQKPMKAGWIDGGYFLGAMVILVLTQHFSRML